MCETDTTTPSDLDGASAAAPFAFRLVPSDPKALLALWADDIRFAAENRHDRTLRRRDRKAIGAALGEQRQVYGLVSVFADGLASEEATRSLIEARLERIAADGSPDESKADERIRSARVATLRLLLIEFVVAGRGGGAVVAA